jgi:hypothetical protein
MGESVDVLRWAPEAQMTWMACDSVTGADSIPLEEAVGRVADRPGIYRARPADATTEPWQFFYVDESGWVRNSGAASHIF